MNASFHIHLDPIGGVAGDMFAAAMLNAFPHLENRVFSDIAAVLPKECGTPFIETVLSNGISASRFGLREDPVLSSDHDHPHPHDHSHDHDHGHDHTHEHGHHHHGRGGDHSHDGTYAHIRGLIAGASLSAGTAEQALSILRTLAEAEATIHGVSLDDVHFHELAGWDSLMDVVAAGSVIAALSLATWSLAPLPLGGGMVRTMHGPLAVPAPATSALLKGYEWRDDGIAGERVTPTGAAIVRHLTEGGSSSFRPGGILHASGYGAGTRVLPGMANVLRVLVFESGASSVSGDASEDTVIVLSFDIDDMNGEEIAVAADRLRRCAGVRDLLLTAAIGKKGRPATTVRLLVAPDAFDSVSDSVFIETSTLGFRWRTERRRILPREEIGDSGGIRLKKTRRPGGIQTTKVESDDLSATAGLAARRALQRKEEDR